MYGYDLPIDALRVLREGENKDIMNYIKNPKCNVLGVETDPALIAIQDKMEKLLDDGRHSGGSWCFTLSIVKAILCGTYTYEELLDAKRKEDEEYEEYELLRKRREQQRKDAEIAEQYQKMKERIEILDKELEIEIAKQQTQSLAEQTQALAEQEQTQAEQLEAENQVEAKQAEDLALKKDELAWEAWDAEREERSASKVCKGNRGSI